MLLFNPDKIIDLKEITVYQGEAGKDFINGAVSFDNYRQANDYLFEQAIKCFKPNPSTFAHDFKVQWDDGFIYEGILLCCYPMFCRDCDLDVGKHIHDRMSFLAGLNKPHNITLKEYSDFLAIGGQQKSYALDFLNKKYELGKNYSYPPVRDFNHFLNKY